MNKTNKLADDFVIFFNKNSNEKLPDSFIRDYYIFTAGKYIAVSEFIVWLNVSRNSFIEKMLSRFKKNQDYFIVNYEDEMKELKITPQTNYRKRTNQKYYLITVNCFKEYCSRSLTEKGNLVRKYYFKLDELFKEFHLAYIEKSDKENEKLLNNQKTKNKISVDGRAGVYIWNKLDDNSEIFRIGGADNVNGRINQHNSSNINKINPKIIVYTKYYKIFESLLKIYLENYLYRGEFYKCDLNIIEKAIKDIIIFIGKSKKDSDLNLKSIVKFYKKNKSFANNISKKSSKKLSKKSSKKLSKKSKN